MKKFIGYLEETYLDSVKPYGWKKGEDLVDIYENPRGDEMRELGKKSLRFILDSKTKSCYIWDAEITHYDVLDQSLVKGPIPSFPHSMLDSGLDALIDSEGWLRYFCGMVGSSGKVFSDTLNQFAADTWWKRGTPEQRKRALSVLDQMLTIDWGWASKYGIEQAQIRKIITSIQKVGRSFAK